jgi:hypothetical protein
MKRLVWVMATLLSGTALAEGEVDPASLYAVSTQGSTATVREGEKGTFVLSIAPKPGAHVSVDTPFKLELSGQKVQLAKTKLALADSVSKPAPGEQYASPRFEVPFTASEAGEGRVDGKVTFFICTETLCARQQRTVQVPVKVEAAGK